MFPKSFHERTVQITLVMTYDEIFVEKILQIAFLTLVMYMSDAFNIKRLYTYSR